MHRNMLFLIHVAMTRAKHHLDVIMPQCFYVNQQTGYGDRTRFIPESLLPKFERKTWPIAERLAGPAT